jgi:predicted DNA-binding protein with PD1-like motif
MEFCQSNHLIMVRLHQDEDLFESLKEVCHQGDLKAGVVLSGIGMLKQAELSYFVASGRYSRILYPEPLELVSLSGNIIRQGGDWHFHLHAVLADEEKATVAGHLSRGKVNVTNEIAILKTDIPAARATDAVTGLMALTFRK